MKNLFSLTLVSLIAVAAPPALADQKINIQFKAQVGEQPFRCGERYPLGVTQAPVNVNDFRFYVHDIALIDSKGKAIPVTLEQDGVWQYQNVALLDFEDKTGSCDNGTTETRHHITGTVPAGDDYKGLQFTLGVPFALNHQDATIAPSPFNLTALFWNWRGGYKFARIDLDNPPGAATEGFAIHLGSIGCKADSKMQAPSTVCKHPNTVAVSFAEFDSQHDRVIADLAALLAEANVEINAADTKSGCMSFPKDADCPPVMNGFGLDYGTHAGGEQKFFRRGQD